MKKLLFLLFPFLGMAQFATNHYIAPSPWQYWSDAIEVVIATESLEVVQFTISKSDGTALYSHAVLKDSPISYRLSGSPILPKNDLDVTTTDRGLIINATAPVTVSVRNMANGSAGTDEGTIKGNAALSSFGDEGIGTEFRLGYYRNDYTGLSGGAPVYSVMALQNNTIISLDGVFLAELNKGESRLFKANMGALLSANKPIVANVGSYSDAHADCGDGTVDQIPPVRSLGKQYIVVRGNNVFYSASDPSEFSDKSTIIASQDNTMVTIIHYNAMGTEISRSNEVLASAGDFVTIYNGDVGKDGSVGDGRRPSTYINADKPIVVYSGIFVECEVDVYTALPIGGCSGLNDIITKAYRNYQDRILSYFGFIIVESETEKVTINERNIGVKGAIKGRVAIGDTGFYIIHFENATISNAENIRIKSNAKFSASLVQRGSGSSMSSTISSFSDNPSMPIEIASNKGSKTLQTESGLSPYQWYLNGVLIPGATEDTFIATQTGNYTVSGTRPCGLTNTSAPLYVTVDVLTSDSFVSDNFSIYPNPTNDIITVKVHNNLQIQKVNVYNTIGELLHSTNQNTVSLKSFAAGIYYVEILTAQGKTIKRVIKK